MQNATVYTNLQTETTFGDIIQTNIWICFFVRIDSNSKIGYRVHQIHCGNKLFKILELLKVSLLVESQLA